MSAGWHVLEQSWGASVAPLDDLIEHEVDCFDECVCGPRVEVMEEHGRAIVSHASLDGRELSE